MMITGAWTLLNTYLAVSFCIILFDLAVALSAPARERRREKRRKELRAYLEEQFYFLKKGKPPHAKIQRRLQKYLSHSGNILLFSDLADEYVTEGNEWFPKYLAASSQMLLVLSDTYQKRNASKKSAFAWALSRCSQHLPQARGFLLNCVLERSIYCRENALISIYRSGKPLLVVEAFLNMSRNGTMHSQKLLADGLLSFSGDRKELCGMLWEQFGKLGLSFQIAAVDFMSRISADYRKDLLALLEQPQTDNELCYAAIRYLGRLPYPPARDLLMEYLCSPRRGQWEYAALSASALRAYPCGETVAALMNALSDHNWYVRYNSADSLISMGLPDEAFEVVLSGGDRFAKEILVYMIKRRQLKNSPVRKGEASVGVS